MPRLGKIDREFFESVIYPDLGADRDDVTVGPTHGVDFGVVDVAGTALVVSTDPVSILPGLGFERAGRLALDVILADVAVSGIPPTHLTVSLSLPPDMTDGELAATWKGLAGRANDVGVSIVSGHTARYSGVDYSWVGGATAMGIGSHDDIVRPDDARPGDRIVVATGPGAEVAGLFSTLFPDSLGLTDEQLGRAQKRLEEIGLVEDATTAVEAGDVTAMHDATEGGLAGALVEMARGAGRQFDVEANSVPIGAGVRPLFDELDIDVWSSTSAGTLVLTTGPEVARDVVEALRNRGTRAAVVGTVTDGSGVFVDGEQISKPEGDPSWEAFARLASGQ